MDPSQVFDNVIKQTANIQPKRKKTMSVEKQLLELANRTSRSGIAIIDAMFQRGAIKGEEAETVGALRGQFIQIVQMYEQLLQEDHAETESED